MMAEVEFKHSSNASVDQGHQSGSVYHFIIIIIIRYETTAAARRALLLIVSTLLNDTITVALWTGFHVCLPMEPSTSLTRRPDATSHCFVLSGA
jgi:hypothetical protein